MYKFPAMETKLAKIISILFQPLLIPTYTLFILFGLNNYLSMLVPAQAKQLLMWIVFLTTFAFPLIFILILYKRGLIRSVNMDQKEERVFPLLITGVFYFLAYYMVHQTHLDVIYQRLFLGSALLIGVALIVSFYWKISMHMIGAGGMLGALIGINLVAYVDLTFFVVLVTFVCGLVAFARLKLKAHTPSQVYSGFLAGFFLMLVLFLI